MRNRTYGGVRGRKVSLPCGKLTFLLLDFAFSFRNFRHEIVRMPKIFADYL